MNKDLNDSNNNNEKNFDDEVYEDDYYDEYYDQEELDDSDTLADDDLGDDDSEDVIKMSVSYACDDCDYRWDDVIIKKKTNLNYDDDPDIICPMCGSMNCSQI